MKHLNKFAWVALIFFIFASLAMNYHSGSRPFEGVLLTLPLPILFLLWSTKIYSLIPLLNEQRYYYDAVLFRLDLYLLTTSFFIGTLLLIIFSYNNADVKGWWPLGLYLMCLYGLIFSLFYSLICKVLFFRKKFYTFIFSFLIIFWILLCRFLPSYITIDFIAIDTFLFGIALLLMGHIIVGVFHKIKLNSM